MAIKLKVYNAYRKVVAVCDSDLVGKRFVDGDRLLDVKESFYTGEVMEKEKALQIIKCEMADDSTFSFVGKESIALGLEAGTISKEGVTSIEGIPFALGLF